MPAGLDGNPNPIRTTERDAVLTAVADRVCTHGSDRVMVGIDGRSGAGKSTFADELARLISQRDRHTIRSTTDSFHRPRGERLKRGATSAEGYYFDSHQLDRIVNELLIPFRQGADEVLIAAFDEPSDTALESTISVDSSAVLVFDGLFLHRPEFAACGTSRSFSRPMSVETPSGCSSCSMTYPGARRSRPRSSIDGSK